MSIEGLQRVDSVLDEADTRLKTGQPAGAKVWLSGSPCWTKSFSQDRFDPAGGRVQEELIDDRIFVE